MKLLSVRSSHTNKNISLQKICFVSFRLHQRKNSIGHEVREIVRIRSIRFRPFVRKNAPKIPSMIIKHRRSSRAGDFSGLQFLRKSTLVSSVKNLRKKIGNIRTRSSERTSLGRQSFFQSCQLLFAERNLVRDFSRVDDQFRFHSDEMKIVGKLVFVQVLLQNFSHGITSLVYVFFELFSFPQLLLEFFSFVFLRFLNVMEKEKKQDLFKIRVAKQSETKKKN